VFFFPFLLIFCFNLIAESFYSPIAGMCSIKNRFAGFWQQL